MVKTTKGKILGLGTIQIGDGFKIQDVLLVEGLKHNLLSISQLCDKGLKVTFESKACNIVKDKSNDTVLKGTRLNNIYIMNLDIASSRTISCLVSKDEDPWLWHRRATHIHMHHLNKLISKELVLDLPKLNFEKDKTCVACQKGKQNKTCFKSKKIISTTKPLKLLHMDLFGPSRTKSLGGNYYALVIVDDYSRFTRNFFLPTKSNAFNSFKKFAKAIQNGRI